MMKKRISSHSILPFYANLLTLLLALLMTACINDSEDAVQKDSLVTSGDLVPSFSIMGDNDSELTSEMLKGKAYVLNFFDTTCPDCQQELDVLQRVYDTFDQTVPIINVPRSQTSLQVKDYWEQNQLDMPYYMPKDDNLYFRFAKSGIPRTYVVDAEGRIVAAFSDSPVADYDTLSSLFAQLTQTVNLQFKVRVPTNRAGMEEYNFHNEYTISKLDVWLFDAQSKKFFKKVSVNGLTDANSTYDTEYDITYIFKDVRLLAGVYDIFTIANFDHTPDNIESEEELLNMVDSLTYSSGIEASISENGPVMTNRATSLLAINLIPYINKKYVVTIDLERVMAKLQIGESQESFELKHNGKRYAQINITNYKLVNLNKKYYMFQHCDNIDQLGPQPEFSLFKHYGDYSDSGQQYVVDPLFYQKNCSGTNATVIGDKYASWFGDFTTEDFASMPSAGNYGYAYILENTVFKTCQKNGFTPGIVFKAAVSPTFVYLYDFSDFTLKEENRPEYWPNTIYLYNYEFYGSIRALNEGSGLTLDELQTYTDEELKAYGIKQCKFNMGVYETYYTYWIHHRENATDPMGPMAFGVVRNNFYRLIVSGVSGIGDSMIIPDILRDNYPNSYADIKIN